MFSHLSSILNQYIVSVEYINVRLAGIIGPKAYLSMKLKLLNKVNFINLSSMEFYIVDQPHVYNSNNKQFTIVYMERLLVLQFITITQNRTIIQDGSFLCYYKIYIFSFIEYISIFYRTQLNIFYKWRIIQYITP